MHHVLLTTDSRYAQHCAVCITSLLINNRDSDFNIVVAGVNLSDEVKRKLEACAKNHERATVKCIDFDVSKLDALPQIGVYSKDIYLRLWVDQYFGDDVEKVLYLDVDTIVVDDISELFSLDISNDLLAAVDIPFADCHHRCHLPKEYDYFNSGVIVFNRKKWKESGCLQSVIEFLNTNRDIALNPDQDALNGLFYESRMKLDYTYNAIGPFFRKNGFQKLGETELKRIRNNVKIVHFNGIGAKPWFYTSNHPYQNKYFEYLKMTPWADFVPEDKSTLNMLKKKLRRLMFKESFVRLAKVKGA